MFFSDIQKFDASFVLFLENLEQVKWSDNTCSTAPIGQVSWRFLYVRCLLGFLCRSSSLAPGARKHAPASKQRESASWERNESRRTKHDHHMATWSSRFEDMAFDYGLLRD